MFSGITKAIRLIAFRTGRSEATTSIPHRRRLAGSFQAHNLWTNFPVLSRAGTSQEWKSVLQGSFSLHSFLAATHSRKDGNTGWLLLHSGTRAFAMVDQDFRPPSNQQSTPEHPQRKRELVLEPCVAAENMVFPLLPKIPSW